MHTGGSLLPCGRCSDHGTKCRPFEGQPQAEFRGLPVRGYWKPRELLFRAGEPLGPVFKITEGIAALFDMLPDGRRQLIKLLWPGALCGYLSENGRYSFEGEALTNVHACSFARDSFDSSVAHDPAFAAALRREMSEVFEEFGRHMTTLGQLDSVERVADFLLDMQRALASDIHTLPIRLPIKRRQMANYLGLRAETVSRAFSELLRRRLIVLEGDVVTIIDLAGLAVSAGRSASQDAQAYSAVVNQ